MPQTPVGGRGILKCFINFGYRKSLGISGRAPIKVLHRKVFVSQCRKISAGDCFTVAIISAIEKVWIRGRGSIKVFHRNFFVSECRKIS